jgi:hypothetical protein
MKLKQDDDEDDTMSVVTPDGKFDPFADMKNHIRIKLVVSETSRSVLEKNMKRLVSPFVSFDHFKAPFGFMHIALCIGAWRLEVSILLYYCVVCIVFIHLLLLVEHFRIMYTKNCTG